MVATRPVLAVVAVLLTLALVGGFVARAIRIERAALVTTFGAQHRQQVEELAREVGQDFDDIGEDLRFARQLIESADGDDDRRRELGALLAVVKGYRLIEVFDGTGARQLSVTDPLGAPDIDYSAFHPMVAATAKAASAAPVGEIVTSPRSPIDATGWIRVFATRVHRPAGGSDGALAILVDTQGFLGKIRLLASDEQSRVLVLGAHGSPTPASDPKVEACVNDDACRSAVDGLRAAVDDMRQGVGGVQRISEEDAPRLGLPPADVVIAYAPIEMRGGARWSIASLTSTMALRSHERAITLRLGGAMTAVSLCLIGIATFALVGSRRAVAVREQLKHAERLAHLHEKSEKILDNIPTGVLVISNDLRITAMNRVLAQRCNPAALGARFDEAFPSASSEARAILATLVEGAHRTGEIQRRLGQRITLFAAEGQYSLHAVPLEPRHPDARILLVVEDLSEVLALEHQLLRAEKLATIGILAAGIAHEIGTPLGIARGRAEYIGEKLGKSSPQSEGVRVIVEQIDLITRTIRQLLDFSRMRPVALRPVNLGSVANEVGELLRFEARRRKVDLQVVANNDLPLVAADADQLQQALVNLVINACDACERGGKVRLAVSRSDDPGALSIEVIDNGVGIPGEHRHQVFDPFFTTKKRGQGTGLGLTIAAQIVRNHGGEIDLRSVQGEGTHVKIMWPLAPSPVERRPDV